MESSASGTADAFTAAVEDDDDLPVLFDRDKEEEEEEPWSEGRVVLRYSAGSKVGLRNSCRNRSEVCADLGSILIGVVRPLLAPGMPLGPLRLRRESPRERPDDAAELFCRRRDIFASDSPLFSFLFTVSL